MTLALYQSSTGFADTRGMKPGQTHLNFSGKTITALVHIGWFGKLTRMIGSLSGPKTYPLGSSMSRRFFSSPENRPGL